MKIVYILVIVVAILACGTEMLKVYNNKPLEYIPTKLYPSESAFQNEAKSPYHQDNLIYNKCYEMVYEYKYEKHGKTKFSDINGFLDWDFIPKDSVNIGKGFKYIKLSAPNPNTKYNYEPQSTIKYEYINSNNEVIVTSHTGVVENHKNILIHNPRGGFFISLFSFPWPSIKFPIKLDDKWEWEWSYNNETFGDARIFNWEGITKMKFSYHVVGREIIELEFGKVKTTKIEAIGTNDIIKNKLTYYFNSQLGFVKQVFETHDSATIELTAISYTNKCESSGLQ